MIRSDRRLVSSAAGSSLQQLFRSHPALWYATAAILFIPAAFLWNAFLVDYAFAQADAPWDYAYNAEEFGDGIIREIFCDIVGLTEGNLGALIFTISGVIGIAAAAFGDYMQAKSAIMAAVGASTLAVGVSLYFGDFDCAANAVAPPAQQQGQQGGAQGGGGDAFDQI